MTLPIAHALPSHFESENSLDDFMSQPTAGLVQDLSELDGDIMILGAGGKMGPTLARMAKRAAPSKRVIAVARYSSPGLKDELEGHGIETIVCDLLDRSAVSALPQIENIIFMAGFKFGADSDPGMTWAMNVMVPSFVAETFTNSRIVVFSTGCVYPFANVKEGGSTEEDPPDPPGEYAITCLGRERIFEYHSGRNGTRCLIFRLNYAIDLRYGVIHDIAQKIRKDAPIDVSMGHVNLIWQGDACAQALRCLGHCQSPALPLNVSGPEIISIRWLARELGRRMCKAPVFTGEEADHSWITNTARSVQLFGYPHVSLMTMLDWVAEWVAADRRSLGKPTKYEVRSGTY